MFLKRNNKGIINHQEGLVLATVLIFTTALMIVGAALAGYAVSEMIIADYNTRDTAIYYILEGGAELGIAVMKKDFFRDELLSENMAGGSFTVYFNDEYEHFYPGGIDEEGEEYYENEEQVRFVRSIASLDGVEKTLTVALVIDDELENVDVLRWYRAFPHHFN